MQKEVEHEFEKEKLQLNRVAASHVMLAGGV